MVKSTSSKQDTTSVIPSQHSSTSPVMPTYTALFSHGRGAAIRHVLPLLHMTSCLHIMTANGPREKGGVYSQ